MLIAGMRIIGRVTSRYVVRQGIRHILREQKFWRGLYGPKGRYPGVSNYRQASKGVQHGLLAGSMVGSFIGNGDDGTGNGQIQEPKTDKSYQARSRPANRRSKKCYPCKHVNARKRYSKFRKSKSRRNRFYR